MAQEKEQKEYEYFCIEPGCEENFISTDPKEGCCAQCNGEIVPAEVYYAKGPKAVLKRFNR